MFSFCFNAIKITNCMKLLRLYFLSFSLFFSFYLVAYDAVGHRIISEIAYENLTKKARKQVDKVLGTRGIIYYSSWADEIRSDKKYEYSYVWHYQNLAEYLSTENLQFLLDNPKAEGEHLFYALDSLCTYLKTNKADAEALKFIVHFVGDLHQPMHMGRAEDLGGNRLPVKWFGRNTNLHAIWDSSVLQSRNMSSTEYARFLSDKYKEVKKVYKNYSMLQSVETSYQLANEIYEYGNEFSNAYHYVYRFLDKAEEMMYLGGIQLANVLNEIYK